MTPPLSWFNQNWFSLAQTLGIVGSIALTAASLRRNTRAQKLSDYLTMISQHRELWSDAHRRPELQRIFQAEVDLLAAPISVAEDEFLNLVIVQFNTCWLLAKEGALVTLDVLNADAHSFFSLPIPRAVWEKTKHSRDPKFMGFIDQSLADKGRASWLPQWPSR